MTAVTTQAVWEQEELSECIRCGELMTVSPVVHGIELGHGVYLCGVCFFHIYDGSKAQALAALGLELGPSGDDDGDDDPDGGPAAPAARRARGTLWLIVGGQSVARELTSEEAAEYEAWAAEVVAETPDPVPCAQCGRPASPYEETPAGRVCWVCWDDPEPEPEPGPGPADPGPGRYRYRYRRPPHRAAALALVAR